MLYVCIHVLFVNVSFWEVRRSNLTPREKNTSPLFRVFVRLDKGERCRAVETGSLFVCGARPQMSAACNNAGGVGCRTGYCLESWADMGAVKKT